MTVQDQTQSSENKPVNLGDGALSVPSGFKAFFCLLGAYMLFRLPWLFMLPMVEAPDEFAHYWVIKFLQEHWWLPTAQDVQAGGASAVYGSLPQLGYIPHVVFGFGSNAEQLALTDRFGSLFMGAVMLFAALKIGAILFPKKRIAVLAVPAAVIVHPQLVFIHSYANNDSTSSALASLLLWLMLLSVKDGLEFKRTMWMGVLVGWLAITKYSGLAVIPVLGLAMIASIFLHGSSIGAALLSFFCAGLLALALSAWWFLQNGAQYVDANGVHDYMGTQTMYRSWAQTFHREMNYYLPVSHIIKSLRWWRMTFFSYWGLFGYMTKYLWRPVYFAYLGMVLLAVLGGLKGLLQIKLNKPTKAEIISWSSLALVVIVNISSMIWASTKNLGGPQGRYLITSEIPIQALIVGGLSLFGPKSGKWLVLAFLIFNTAVSIGAWIYLFKLYGGWHLNPLH